MSFHRLLIHMRVLLVLIVHVQMYVGIELYLDSELMVRKIGIQMYNGRKRSNIEDCLTVKVWKVGWTKYVYKNKVCSLDTGQDFRKFVNTFYTGC